MRLIQGSIPVFRPGAISPGRDAFHFNLLARAMDWRTPFAGSKREGVSWVAGREHSCLNSLLLVVVSIYYKPSLFNAHTKILIVHIFMNVNKLCLNQ